MSDPDTVVCSLHLALWELTARQRGMEALKCVCVSHEPLVQRVLRTFDHFNFRDIARIENFGEVMLVTPVSNVADSASSATSSPKKLFVQGKVLVQSYMKHLITHKVMSRPLETIGSGSNWLIC